MKVFHTADVHLTKNHPERFEALEQIVDICEREEADLLLITGDLFDANADLEDLKTDLRGLFSNTCFETLVIPGNHDKNAFRSEDFFGNDFTVLENSPVESREYEEVNVVGVPYTEEEFSTILEDILEAYVEGKKNILMLHCSLTGVSGGFGGEEKYLPVRPEELIQTGFDYILAGHIHSSATRRSFENTVFAYSGSPVSVSRSETGRRNIWRLDDENLSTVPLDTFHYVRQEKEILPGEEESKIRELEQYINGEDVSSACLIVELSGFTERKVTEIKSEMEDITGEASESDIVVDNLESVKSLTDSEIYREFRDKLDEKDFDKKDKIESKFLRALSRDER